MKKLIASLIMTIASVAAFAAEFDRQTANSLIQELVANQTIKDQTVVAKAAAFAESATGRDDWEKMKLIYLRNIIRVQTAGTDMSWEAEKTFVDTQIMAANLSRPPTTPEYLGVLYIWWSDDWKTEFYHFMKTQPGYENWIDAGHCARKVGQYEEAYNLYMVSEFFPERAVAIASQQLNDPERAFSAAKLIVKRTYSAQSVQSVLNAVVNHLAGTNAIPAADMKEFLQGANRKYSAMLLKDKVMWEPVVAMIRTMLETY